MGRVGGERRNSCCAIVVRNHTCDFNIELPLRVCSILKSLDVQFPTNLHSTQFNCNYIFTAEPSLLFPLITMKLIDI